MMKWFFVTWIVLALPIILYSNVQSIPQRLLISDPLNEKLNRLIINELQKRIPNKRSYYFRKPPVMMPWHRLTKNIPCIIQLKDFKTKDPQEALDALLSYAQAYVDTMNNIREIRPYLTEFPFSSDMRGLQVDFARDPKSNMYFYAPYICDASMLGSEFAIHRLYKEKQDANGELLTNVYENICENILPAPEVLRQIELPHYDRKRESKEIPVSVKFCDFNSGFEKEFNFFRNWAAQNSCILLALEHIFGVLDNNSEKVRCIQLALASQNKFLTLEDSKELVKKIRETIIQFSSDYVKIKNWVNLFRKEGTEVLSPIINLQEYMSFRISFWDEYIDRVKAPHIAEIRVIGQKARYYIADELQRLQLVHEEELPPHTIEIPVPKELLKEKPKEH